LSSDQLQSGRLEVDWLEGTSAGRSDRLISGKFEQTSPATTALPKKRQKQWRFFLLLLLSYVKQHRLRLVFHVCVFGIERCLKIVLTTIGTLEETRQFSYLGREARKHLFFLTGSDVMFQNHPWDNKDNLS